MRRINLSGTVDIACYCGAPHVLWVLRRRSGFTFPNRASALNVAGILGLGTLAADQYTWAWTVDSAEHAHVGHGSILSPD